MKKFLTAACLMAAAGAASGQVIITEVMYNPAGAEAETEFIELTNVGPFPVDITNYAFDDEDGSTPSHRFGSGAVRLPNGTILPESADVDCVDVPLETGGAVACDTANEIILQPGESIVVASFWDERSFGGNAGNGRANSIEGFVASWGDDTDGDGIGDTLDYRVVFILKTATIANTASATNEILELVELNGSVIESRDLVNYQVGNSQNQWPFSSNGRSIYLQPNFFPDAAAEELIGEAWALSVEGVDGGINGRLFEAVDTDDESLFTLYSDSDVASPGFVPGLADSFVDANNNGRDDAVDIFIGSSEDCNRNRIPDETEPDCNGNGIPDSCEFQLNQEDDCDGDGQPDDCQISNDPALDMNGNGVIDSCENLAGFGDIIMTEIMFNPSGSEREWIELFNTGGSTVDISGWFFQDLDQPVFDGAEARFDGDPSTPELDPILLAPGQVAVIAERTLEDWEAAWGPVNGDYVYVSTPGINLSNNADLVNEVRSLLAPTATTVDPDTGEEVVTESVRVDVANLQSTTSNGVPQGGWPGDDGRGSFFLLGDGASTSGNNDGGNWSLSIRSVDGARSPEAAGGFDGRDAGSPGVFNIGTPIRPLGDVIFSEIHYATNGDFPGLPFPDETNGIDEWVEILNVSGAPIDISGWTLEDEDGATTPLPQGATLQPGEAAVIIGNDFPGENPSPVSEFYSAWACGFQVFAVRQWYDGGLNRLGDAAEGGSGTNPSTGREILTLRTADDEVQDVVNYDDDGFVWPLVANGFPFNTAFSILVLQNSDLNELDNDNGDNWAVSIAGLDGATQNVLTTVYNAPAFGSPGFVDGITTGFDPSDCISPDPVLPLCADQNGDSIVDSADFFAWVANFGDGNPIADVNEDGDVSSSDFFAWVSFFGQGQNGPLCLNR
ncbi:MAG: lamin tail domain-containing protein [Planctomycetota bacterium]